MKCKEEETEGNPHWKIETGNQRYRSHEGRRETIWGNKITRGGVEMGEE